MIRGYKAVNLDMTPTHDDSLVYEIGKWYRFPQDKRQLIWGLNGFHFCEEPEDVFIYFPPKYNGVRIFECESDGNYEVEQAIYHYFIDDCEKIVGYRICKDMQGCKDMQKREKLLDEMKNCQKIVRNGNNMYVADSIRLTRELSVSERATLNDKLVIHKDCCCRNEAAQYGRKQDLDILVNDIEPFVKKLAQQQLERLL